MNSVIINNQKFPVEYLTSPEEMSRGMMGRDKLDGCMAFKMGEGHHSFWMKNCKLPLDIVFVLGKRISQIHKNCPVPDPHIMNPPIYSGIGDHVLEFPGGTATNWKVGDKVNLYLGSPLNPVKT